MVGGQGGGGSQSFCSEPRKIFGGPDGGNGGDGGHVILKGKTQRICLTSVVLAAYTCCLVWFFVSTRKKLFLSKLSLLLYFVLSCGEKDISDTDSLRRVS